MPDSRYSARRKKCANPALPLSEFTLARTNSFVCWRSEGEAVAVCVPAQNKRDVLRFEMNLKPNEISRIETRQNLRASPLAQAPQQPVGRPQAVPAAQLASSKFTAKLST